MDEHLKKKPIVSWSEFFKVKIKQAGGETSWVEGKWKTHQLVYDVLEKLMPKGKMLETGCGLAATSHAMSLRHFSCTALDIDQGVLDLAKQIGTKVNSNVTFIQGDMFDLSSFVGQPYDIVYSGGVLEHLNKSDAIKLLKQQKEIASKYVAAVIPSKFVQDDAPIARFPYTIQDIIQFGKKAGLNPHSVLLFKGIEPSQYHLLAEHKNITDYIQSLDQIQAQRIGVVFENHI